MEYSALDSLPESLLERLTADVKEHFGFDTTPDVGEIRLLRKPYSRVFRVQLKGPADGPCVYLKAPIRSPKNEHLLLERLETEYRVLKELSARMPSTARAGVVEPLAYYPEQPAVATVEAPGATLGGLVSRHARWYSLSGQCWELPLYANLCGRWLRDFHDATAQGARRFDIDEHLEYCEPRLSLLCKIDRVGFDAEQAKKVLARLTALAASVPEGDNTVAGRHNDFAGHNIIAGHRGVRVLDFSMYDHGSTYFDVCNFWLDLDVLKMDRAFAPRVLSALQGIFLDSYGGASPAHPLFTLVRCRYVLNRLLTTVNSLKKWNRSYPARRRLAKAYYQWLTDFADGRL